MPGRGYDPAAATLARKPVPLGAESDARVRFVGSQRAMGVTGRSYTCPNVGRRRPMAKLGRMRRSSGWCGRSSRLHMLCALALIGPAVLAPLPAAADPETVMPPNETVLAAICGRPARKEAQTCRMKNGRAAEFWYGAMFSTETGSWFTGFATMPAPGEDAESPNARSVVAATFALNDMRWHLKGVQTLAGQIGTGNRNGEAPEVDDTLGAVVKAMSRGRLLMGLRLTSRGTAGSSSFSFLLLQFSEAPLHWRLAGEIPAGSDDTASCDSEDGAPCQMGASKGRLEILPEDPAKPLAWPPVRITLTGTVRGDDGKVRPATSRDARVYRFDEAGGTYR